MIEEKLKYVKLKGNQSRKVKGNCEENQSRNLKGNIESKVEK